MKFKLKWGEDPPKPGDLIGVSYGGAGSIWPSIFIGARYNGHHFIISHYCLGWRHRNLPPTITPQWIRQNSDRIYGERVVDRIIYADPKCLAQEESKVYNRLKPVLQDEYQEHWAVHPI